MGDCHEDTAEHASYARDVQSPSDLQEEPEPDLPSSLSLISPSLAEYRSELGLEQVVEGPGATIWLPLVGVPHLTVRECRDLQRWASQLQSRTLPNGLLDAYAVGKVPPQWVATLSSQDCGLIEGALDDLRQKMEERNVHSLQRGRCARQAEKLLLSLDLEGIEGFEDRVTAEYGVGLDGLCRAVAERAGVLGRGGWKLLQTARKALRTWLEDSGADVFECDLSEACCQVDARLPPEIKDPVRRRVCTMAVASYRAVHADIARCKSGERGEETLMSRLQKAGIDREAYYTEGDLRDVQTRLFGRLLYGTPDVLLRRPVIVNGDTLVHWIDSKGSCPLPGFAFQNVLEKLQRQLGRFVELFGPGLVVWRGGFAAAPTEQLPGVRAAAWVRSTQPCAEGEPTAGPACPPPEAWVRWQ